MRARVSGCLVVVPYRLQQPPSSLKVTHKVMFKAAHLCLVGKCNNPRVDCPLWTGLRA